MGNDRLVGGGLGDDQQFSLAEYPALRLIKRSFTSRFLACRDHKDESAPENRTFCLQSRSGCDEGGNARFHVAGAAPMQRALVEDGVEGREVPLGSTNRNHVKMARECQRPPPNEPPRRATSDGRPGANS